jgi:hypothetical protein
VIRLEFCTVEFHPWGARTTFPGGETVDATPHDTHHYHVISHRCGYGDDVMAYCREHEFAHAFVAERLRGAKSVVLWGLAIGQMPDRGAVTYEEVVAQAFQRWLRAHERPIISGVDWDALKADALELLA